LGDFFANSSPGFRQRNSPGQSGDCSNRAVSCKLQKLSRLLGKIHAVILPQKLFFFYFGRLFRKRSPCLQTTIARRWRSRFLRAK
jgi:hypothetical protein